MNSPNNQSSLRRCLADHVLPRLISRVLNDRAAPRHPDQVYTTALQILVDALLPGELSGPDIHDVMPELPGCGSGLPAEQVGRLYEYFRGFRLDVKACQKPVLVPSRKGKRNQGLFYTPPPIVRHIVKSVLDAMSVSDPAGYLNLRILDPAAGTGTFLLEAMEELTSRGLSGMEHMRDSAPAQSYGLREPGRQEGLTPGLNRDQGWESVIRSHIMSCCLYGVDLDRIAVKIARAALQSRSCGGPTAVRDLEPAVREGNALIGQSGGEPSCALKEELDLLHASPYLGTKHPDPETALQWSEEKKVIHWPLEYPEVFSRDPRGFDCVIGNPPYEILSVKESGIAERSREQAYFRTMYRTCQGKINTYRLMIERGLGLLRPGGVLGFIVPFTLLADSTAEKLRRMILDESEVLEMAVIPEKAQAFPGVTQAFVVLICRKGKPTQAFSAVTWQGVGSAPRPPELALTRDLVERTGFRIPYLKSAAEKELLTRLSVFPRLGGDERCPAAGKVHQGEINLTVDREWITNVRTEYPLIRGEHVTPLGVRHPSARTDRLDWILPEFPDLWSQRAQSVAQRRTKSPGLHSRSSVNPWDKPRIVLGRVVNMDTSRRLKAAAVAPGEFLGDMTNFIEDCTLPRDYLLGLLNSQLLNWRIKLTSTNNYLSAAEVEALPIPRLEGSPLPETYAERIREQLASLIAGTNVSLSGWVAIVRELALNPEPKETATVWAELVQTAVAVISKQGLTRNAPAGAAAWNALDAAVLLLYGCESAADVLFPQSL